MVIHNLMPNNPYSNVQGHMIALGKFNILLLIDIYFRRFIQP